MFILAKLFWIVAQPLCFAFFAVVVGLLAMWMRRRATGIILCLIGVGVLFVALFTSVGSYLVQTLEDRFPRPVLASAPACIIILGGGIDTDVSTARGIYALNDDGDRYVEAVRLARLYPDMPIIMSGGGDLRNGTASEAEIAGRMFADFGIAPERITNDPTSRDTYENAVNTKAILERLKLTRCLLITSGFHMPRSVAIFRHLDMDIIPWVTDYKSTGREGIGLEFRWPLRNAGRLSVATKEWIGMIAYYSTGRLSTFYPTPEILSRTQP